MLQVVGDGPLRTHYERSARRLGIWDRIEWLGMRLEERPRLYREATVFAAPCTLASFGVVLLEALASGTPVVCADNVGFRQVLRDGMPGRFTRPDDPADLAAALAELLDDPARRAEWAVRGRRAGRGALRLAGGGPPGRGALPGGHAREGPARPRAPLRLRGIRTARAAAFGRRDEAQVAVGPRGGHPARGACA